MFQALIRVYQLQYISKCSIYIMQFSIFISVEWMCRTWIMGSDSWVQIFQGGGLCMIRLIWQYSIQPLLHCTWSTCNDSYFRFCSKWWNQRDGAPESMHYLGRSNFEKIEVMWRVLLIFLDGILAQKTLIYIAADTLYYCEVFKRNCSRYHHIQCLCPACTF